MHKILGVVTICILTTTVLLPATASASTLSDIEQALTSILQSIQRLAVVSTASQQAGVAGVVQAGVDPNSLIPAFDAHLDAVHAPTGTFGTGQVWRVGPNETNKSFAAISRSLKDGDTVYIDAGTYGCSEQSIVWYANNISVIGVGGRPVFDLTGCTISGDKGIFNPRGKNMIIANIEFAGAHGPSANDAGIRLDGGGYVFLYNDYFHDNQDGILMTPDVNLIGATMQNDLVIDHSEFAHNGDGSGQSHNMYIQSTFHSFVLRFSYSHDAHVGHEVKSRAQSNYILYNRLTDEANGDASYEVDLPQGGLSYIVGNVLQKDRGENYSVIEYACESTTNPVQKLYVAYNTVVDDMNNGHTLYICDKSLAEAVLTNNLIVGADKGIGGGIAKVADDNNLITKTPGFYDQTNRVYYLTSASSAIDKGTDPGTYGGFSLSPIYEFAFPATGIARPAQGTLDIGAYEYDPSQMPPTPPVVSLTADATTVEYNATATLHWTAPGADYCTAGGAWSGSQPSTGSFTTTALQSNQTYSLSCTGTGGTGSASLQITVNESTDAAKLGTYTWQDIPGSAINPACAASIKNPDGSYTYQDNFGTGPYCSAGDGGSSTGVFVPDTNIWYRIGSTGGRNYYGNEIYALDLNTMKPKMVTTPDHISDTKEYVPSDVYGSKVHIPGCGMAIHLASDGSELLAPFATQDGNAAWNPLSKRIVLGGSYVHGDQGCSPVVNGTTYYGQYTLDSWAFDPAAAQSSTPVPSTSAWSRLQPERTELVSVCSPLWFLDPATGIAYSAGNRNYFGGYLIDTSKPDSDPVLVNNVYPFDGGVGLCANRGVAIDTMNHYAFVLASGKVGVWDLNGLSMTKYGTNGSGGTSHVVGGPGPLFKPDISWTVVGNTDVYTGNLENITYNPKLAALVVWEGNTVYFLYPDYATKTLKSVAKIDIPGSPPVSGGAGKFVYVPSKDAYLAYSGVGNDFHWLLPPDTTPVSPAPTARLTADHDSISNGQSATLTWSSTDATSCTGTGFSASDTSGSVTVMPTQTTTYSVTCTGAGGTASDSATVMVGITDRDTQLRALFTQLISLLRQIISILKMERHT